MLQRPKNTPRNGDHGSPLLKTFKTQVIKQGADICRLGQRWNLLADYPVKSAIITAEYCFELTN
jgi:hypothetical protein